MENSILSSDYLEIQVDYIYQNYSYSTGSLQENLGLMLSSHIPTKTNETLATRVVNFQFEQKYPLLNEVNVHIGEIDLIFEVKLAKKDEPNHEVTTEVAPHSNLLSTHKIDELQLTLVSAHFNTAFTGLMAIACIESTGNTVIFL